jgi:probable F420-dependent oxidoreductase
LTRKLRENFRGGRRATSVAAEREHVGLEPCRPDVEQLDVGRVRDEPLDVVEDLAQVAVTLCHHRNRDRRALPRVLVIDLGDGDAKAVSQPVDDRTEHRSLRLERMALGHEELEADRGGVHDSIVPVGSRARSNQHKNGTYDRLMAVDLGRVGVWTSSLDTEPASRIRELAAELDEMGWGALWLPEAVGRDPFLHAALLLGATDRLVLATGIANVYLRAPAAMNAAWNTVSEAFPGRFLLGLGVSHQPMVEGLVGQEYLPPLAKMRDYLDSVDSSLYIAPPPGEPPERVLAALGPKMLELARDRARGAHPYFVPPEHTEIARTILGDDRLLAPEQMVVLETDPARARSVARAAMGLYVTLPNYANNLLRLGFTEDDLASNISDRLVDAIVAWGDAETIARRVRAHHDAGADHVCIQVLPRDDIDRVMLDYRALAEVLL